MVRWRGGLEASPTGTWCEAPLGLLFDMLVARPCSNPSNAIRVSGGLDRVGLVREDYVMRPIVVVGVGVGVGVSRNLVAVHSPTFRFQIRER